MNGSIFRINRDTRFSKDKTPYKDHLDHDVGGETYSRTPRGYSGTPDQERLLRHSALYAHAELPPDLAVDPRLVPTLLRHWRAFAPLHRWLEANVHLNAEA